MKERLTGAIIVVALLVLVVPELLTGPVRSPPRAVPAGAAEDAPLRSYTINLADDARARAVEAGNPAAGSAAAGSGGPGPLTPLASATPASQAAEAPAPPEASPPAEGPPPGEAAPPVDATPASSEPAPKSAGGAAAEPAKASPARRGAGDWAVQLGSFAKRSNAERLARQVKAQGFKVSVSQESSGRRLYRVRVGSAPDRAAASALASQLQAAGHRGAVVPK